MSDRKQFHLATRRNALNDFAHVPSMERFAGRSEAAPLLTIAIPTYRRPHYLLEAVRSAVRQRFDRPIEVIVLDNDPASQGWEALVDALPELATTDVRYFVNRENIGLFGNWNRCVELARGEWFTMLHDDDLLAPNFAERMFAMLREKPRIDGLVCLKQSLDERDVPFIDGKLRTLAKRTVDGWRHRGDTRRIGPRKLFWGNLLGSNVGFVCRKRDIVIVGGFYPEENPSGDYFFYARFAQQFELHQAREALAVFRMAENNSAVIETQIEALCRGYDLQRSYAGNELPGWWRRISPWLLARHVAATTTTWRTEIDMRDLQQRLGLTLPRDRPVALYVLRAVLRGY